MHGLCILHAMSARYHALSVFFTQLLVKKHYNALAKMLLLSFCGRLSSRRTGVQKMRRRRRVAESFNLTLSMLLTNDLLREFTLSILSSKLELQMGRTMSNSCLPSVRKLFGGGLTASAIIAPSGVSGSHVVKIDGYSRTKGLGNGKLISSETFNVGGHTWCLRYYPDGIRSDDKDWISIYLRLVHSEAKEVRAEFKISLLDQDSQPVPSYSICSSQIRIFSDEAVSWGYCQFIEREVLEKSLSLRDDVFSIRCDVTVMKEIFTEPIPPPLVVPPSNMHQHLRQLLLSDEATDVTFEVGVDTFPAHRCILAARSPVFKAELLGPMKEKTEARIQINDMDSDVFRALLHFIYTDYLPEIAEGDTAAMCQHLLVAADRYNMERLKLICEEKLCNRICKRTAATTLTLAEQHSCGTLKKACFKFLTSPRNLKAVMASDGYQHLRSSCPSVIEELLTKLAP